MCRFIVVLPLLLLLAGCGGEPQRGAILEEVEKHKDSDQVFRKWEYYKNARGQKIAHGPLTQYYPTGEKQFEINHKDGKYHGTYKQYFKSGKVEIIAEYADGQEHGKLQKFFENGQVMIEGQNVEGLQDGIWKYYDKEGKVTKTEHWKKGRLQN